MRKAQKRQAEELVRQMEEAHGQIKKDMEGNNLRSAMGLLEDCQSGGISLGTLIEETEGEGHPAVSLLEEYCELVYRIYENLSGEDGTGEAGEKAGKAEAAWNAETTEKMTVAKAYKLLRQKLLKIENCIRNEIKTRVEAVFLPYKASMWDSLESVWQAAEADPDCDAYVIPIPYYDRNPDGSFGRMHYEGDRYPAEVPVTAYDTFDFAAHRPDMIFIHNPYDNYNFVTSVHPFFYSDKLKKYTDCLVYIPYYATAGGMSEGQAMCAAYANVDYIVIQSPMFRNYYDARIPDEKFLPFGSPKFDRIIRKCKNPLEPPAEWKKKMEGRKVYFYNTSIGGMLGDTNAFLKKLRYVFDTFKGRDDVCILWRPHPLLESTFDSMRPGYKAEYEQIKRDYIENDIGIFDDSPDMADAVSWSDAYIGDSATSVTSLFGIVGKPMFILNNQLWSKPVEDSWRGAIVGTGFRYSEKDRFAITQGNKLYISEPYQYDYKYFCDLSEYTDGEYYLGVLEIKGKRYVCPRNAQNILVLNDKGVEKKIELEKRNGNNGSFFNAWTYEGYLILLPFKYPALVRYNTKTGEIKYFEDNIDVFAKNNERNERITGGSWIYNGILYIASPTDSHIYKFNIESGKSEVISLSVKNEGGCISMIEKEGSIWMLPYRGQTVLSWNPITGDIREYTGFPEGFQCLHPIYRMSTDEYPLSSLAFAGNMIYFTQNWGNMDIKLNTETGEFSKWEVPILSGDGMGDVSKEYFNTTGKYVFVWSMEEKDKYKIFCYPQRKLYDFDIQKNELNEIKITFDVNELKQHEDGFNDYSQGLKYCCRENAFNSLGNFLDGNITGKQFNRMKQIKSYEEITANGVGGCGEKIYMFTKSL